MPKTIEEVRAEFKSKGITFAAWAKANGIPKSAVRGLMSGATKGTKGMGRKAALLLGLVEPTPGEVVPPSVDVEPTSSTHLEAGELGPKAVVKKAISRAIRNSGLGRGVIADELSRLTGEPISHHQINNWTSTAKQNRSMPLEYAAALGVVTGDHAALRAVAELAGCILLEPDEVPLYELGRITAEDKRRAKLKRQLWEQIG